MWGWVPIFLNDDLSSDLEYSILKESTAQCVMVPVSAEVFFVNSFSRICRGPICFNVLSVRTDSPQELGCFLLSTKVHSYKSPQIFYFKGNTCSRCKSLFTAEKSANDHYRRNLKRKFCAKPRGLDASNVPPRRVAQSVSKNKGKKRKRTPHAANAFWSL